MGYLLGYKYDGRYRVWVLELGVRESRDVLFTRTPPGLVDYYRGKTDSRRTYAETTCHSQKMVFAQG
jgi:hypothetical protein